MLFWIFLVVFNGFVGLVNVIGYYWGDHFGVNPHQFDPKYWTTILYLSLILLAIAKLRDKK